MATRLLHQGLTAGGAASSVTIISWLGEQSTANATSKVASRSMTSAKSYFPVIRQQYKSFSSKGADPTTKMATRPTEKVVAAPVAPLKSTGSFMEWYEGHLERSPVRTKMVTGSILWGVGDAVAQVVPQLADAEKKEISYDFSRTGRAVFFGFALHAPTSHIHFNFLEWMTVRAGFTGLGIPVFKTIMEQFVYWSWISNSMYHGTMGALQGLSPSECYKRIEDLLWDTQKAQWAFWIPVQLLNFRFIPVRHQLNVVLLTSIVWTALLSAWYPPVQEDTEGEKKAD